MEQRKKMKINLEDLKHLKTQGDRCRFMRELKQLTREEFAKLLKKSRGFVYRFENNLLTRTSAFDDIADVLGVTTKWLKTGKNPGGILVCNGNMERLIKDFPTEYPPLDHFIPVVTWQEAGDTVKECADVNPTEVRQYIRRIPKAHPSSFAIRVEDDAMGAYHPSQVSFGVGDILTFDPHADYHKDSYVLARRRDGNEAFFRKLVYDNGDYILVPINHNYTHVKIDKNIRLFGVLVHRDNDFNISSAKPVKIKQIYNVK